MICSGFDISSPFFWIFLSALFTGAAFSRISIISSRQRNPEHSRKSKWVFVSLYLSAAVLFALLAVFIPGADKIIDYRLVYFFTAVMVLSFLVFRFKLIVGIPIFIILTILLFVFSFSLSDWSCYQESDEVASIRALSVGDNQLKIEIQQLDDEIRFISIDGDSFAPVFQILEFPDYFFIARVKTFYRFIEISVHNDEIEVPPISISHNSDSSFNLINFIIEKFPAFLCYNTSTTDPFTPVLFREYKINIHNRTISIDSFQF